MSGSGPVSLNLADKVLMLLWYAAERSAGVSMQELLRQTLAPLPHLQEALVLLAGRGCQIERTPSEVTLAAVGIQSWRPLFMTLARREKWRIGRGVHVLPTAAS